MLPRLRRYHCSGITNSTREEILPRYCKCHNEEHSSERDAEISAELFHNYIFCNIITTNKVILPIFVFTNTIPLQM